MSKKTNSAKPAMLAAAASIGVMIFVGASYVDWKDSSPTSAPGFGSTDALTMCQMAFKRISNDPDKASIPYVPDQRTGLESYFAWGASTKMMRMRNGLGLDVAVSGSCIVNHRTRKITNLTLDGKTII